MRLCRAAGALVPMGLLSFFFFPEMQVAVLSVAGTRWTRVVGGERLFESSSHLFDRPRRHPPRPPHRPSQSPHHVRRTPSPSKHRWAFSSRGIPLAYQTKASPAASRSPSPTSAHDILTLRALVSTKEAGVIIGKGGKNVADLREQTGVRAGVSKVIPGVHERVLTVGGSVDAIAKVRPLPSSQLHHSQILCLQAYNLIITQLVSSSPSPVALSSSSPHTSIRLLISHNLMGTVIGRNGLKIKAIQDISGARMVASKEMLPQSTERIVEVQGSPESISRAIEEIGKCLLEDWERGAGTVPFHPGVGEERLGSRRSANGYGGGSSTRRPAGDATRRGSSPPSPHSPPMTQPPANLRTQNILIPADMVGCIIGRNGSKITEIRRLSGSKISIAKAPHDNSGERMFTIIGTPAANEKALFLLYNQLESEKERRIGREQQQQDSQE